MFQDLLKFLYYFILKSKKFKNTLLKAHSKVLYQYAYSPDFAQTEIGWSILKQNIKKNINKMLK